MKHVEICKIPFVSQKSHLEEIAEEAGERLSIVAFTLVLPELREHLLKLASEKNLIVVDVLGPMMEAVSKITKQPPKLEPGLMQQNG